MAGRVGLSGNEGAQGLPANDRKESSGRVKSQGGREVSSLDERRSRPSFRQWDISSGRDVSLLPANMHF